MLSAPILSLRISPPALVQQLETELALSHADLARALGVDPRTVERWLTGERYPQHETRRRLVELLSLYDHLSATFNGPEAARDWFHSPSRYLRGFTPADALRLGRFDRVEAALEALDSGAFI
jgi:transcriptional regulator with XRE-family HTH domain